MFNVRRLGIDGMVNSGGRARSRRDCQHQLGGFPSIRRRCDRILIGSAQPCASTCRRRSARSPRRLRHPGFAPLRLQRDETLRTCHEDRFPLAVPQGVAAVPGSEGPPACAIAGRH